MPLIHLAFQGGDGPHIKALIGISAPRQRALVSAGLPVPTPVLVKLLIDTGASGTCLDPISIGSLGLSPTGTIPIQTPTTNGVPHQCNLYDISLIIPAPKGQPFYIDALPIVESSLKSQGIDGLLGRDVLANCVLIYNGSIGWYTLSY